MSYRVEIGKAALIGTRNFTETSVYRVIVTHICSECDRRVEFRGDIEFESVLASDGRLFREAILANIPPVMPCTCHRLRCMIGGAIQRRYRGGFRKEWYGNPRKAN